MSAFSRLNYSFPENTANNKVPNFSANVTIGLGKLPPLLSNNWQYQEVANGTVGVDYFRNPVGNITNTIISICTQIEANCNNASLTSISTAANSVSFNIAPLYIDHTQRCSGIVKVNDDRLPNLPHYEIAVGVGKALSYYLYQSDNIANSSAILGSLTSILVGDELQEKANTLNSHLANIVYSFTVNGSPPPDYTSNLSAGQISTIVSDITSVGDFFDTRRNHDVSFFRSAQVLVADFNTMRAYNAPGQTETYLIQNFIGTDNLKGKMGLE